MTTTKPPSLSPRAKSLVRLLVMVELSLVLHLAIIFGIQVGAVERGSQARQPIEARLMSAQPAQDAPPALVSQVRPAYPTKAVDADVKGDVLVLFMLNENGSVDEVSVLEENPPGYGFDAAVNEWLKQARFKPAMRKGRAVKSRVVDRVNFEP